MADSEERKDWLGRGWAFPVRIDTASGGIALSQYEDDIREAIKIILDCAPGERVMRPEFGGGLRGFVHRPNNETTRGLIASAVRDALARFEPRVVIEKVEVRARRDAPSAVDVLVRYADRASGERASTALSVDLAS